MANCRTTQGGITSPKIFNVVVGSVVCHCLSLMVEYEAVIQEGLGHVVGRSLFFFNEYYGLLGSRFLEWIHGALYVLIGLFWRIVLAVNVSKLKTMTCQTGEIISGMSEEAFGCHSVG